MFDLRRLAAAESIAHTWSAESEAWRSWRLALRRKEVRSGSAGASTPSSGSASGDRATSASAFTAISRVISLRSRSTSTCLACQIVTQHHICSHT